MSTKQKEAALQEEKELEALAAKVDRNVQERMAFRIGTREEELRLQKAYQLAQKLLWRHEVAMCIAGGIGAIILGVLGHAAVGLCFGGVVMAVSLILGEVS